MTLWTGVVWIIVLFLSAVGTLILTASIHYRGSIGEQVMENVSQSDEETNSWRPEGKYIFSIPRDRYWGLQIHINSFIKAGITNLISHTSILLAGCFFKDKCTDCMRKKLPSSTVSHINIGCFRLVIGLFA